MPGDAAQSASLLVNADFSRSVVVTPDRYQWVASPQGGVERVMLDRVGGEKARATSLVRYASHSHFPFHVHAGGEEILVLSGVFSEGANHYPEGWYLRNPPGSSHQPSSAAGAVIFVKLCQMPASERESVRIDTRDPARWSARSGREACHLFRGPSEVVRLEKVAAGQRVFDARGEGAEMLVLAGELGREGERYGRGTWIRLPPGAHPAFVGGEPGATLYVKTGHLGPPHLQARGVRT